MEVNFELSMQNNTAVIEMLFSRILRTKANFNLSTFGSSGRNLYFYKRPESRLWSGPESQVYTQDATPTYVFLYNS